VSINPLLVAATAGAIARKREVPLTRSPYRNERFQAFWRFGWQWMDDRICDKVCDTDLLDESTIMAQMVEAAAKAKVAKENLHEMPADRLVIWLIRLARGGEA
jgi:hypothetical protein